MPADKANRGHEGGGSISVRATTGAAKRDGLYSKHQRSSKSTALRNDQQQEAKPSRSSVQGISPQPTEMALISLPHHDGRTWDKPSR